ncbi:Zn(2)-C6 fungal-type domain-containing protein [Mycena chlorophos]|uniref:Zn(2)-C6 fungal-type domain-containing protein n=1 Tax=Mycena chlorophos TaxID=658473 RepID=A0A8H6VVC4_MYCCL|nr:Zn(2)-C6 fungal-type domain-containing protein [Mycena chlorophos]
MENLKNGLTMLPLQRRARIACEQCSISKVKCERHDKLDTLSPCDRCVERGYVCASREKARPRGNGHRKQPREAGTGGGASKRRRSEAEAGLPVEGVGSGRRRRSAPSLELSLSFPYGATAPPLPEPMATTSTLPRHPHLEAEPSTRALYGELTLKPDERVDSAFDSAEFDTTIFYPKPVHSEQGWNESFSFNAHEPSYHYVPVNPQLPSPHSNLYSRSTLGRDHSAPEDQSYSELTEAHALYYTPRRVLDPEINCKLASGGREHRHGRSLGRLCRRVRVPCADSRPLLSVNSSLRRSRLELAFIERIVILAGPN